MNKHQKIYIIHQPEILQPKLQQQHQQQQQQHQQQQQQQQQQQPKVTDNYGVY